MKYKLIQSKPGIFSVCYEDGVKIPAPMQFALLNWLAASLELI